jgi:apolipoprotein D and lipocalin family protein
MKISQFCIIAALAAFSGAGPVIAGAPAPGPAPEPSKAVDPTRYVGRWYEIARLPNMLQKDCQAPTSDWQKGDDGAFSVVQSCRVGSPEGPLKVWRAAGRIIDAGLNAKIRMGFFGGFIHQDYWIVDRADDYSWCITSTPTSKYLWIMARRPELSSGQTAALVARARTLGYDTARLIYDEQPPA